MEIILIIIIYIKFLVKIVVRMVGSDVSKFFILIFGKLFFFVINKFWMNSVVRI